MSSYEHMECICDFDAYEFLLTGRNIGTTFARVTGGWCIYSIYRVLNVHQDTRNIIRVNTLTYLLPSKRCIFKCSVLT